MLNLNLFSKTRPDKAPRKHRAVVQTVAKPQGIKGIPLFETMGAKAKMFNAVRNTVPVIDAAILKIIRLMGDIQVECSDKNAERALKRFLKTVPTGPVSSGIQSFISSYLDSLLTYGNAVGEMVIGSKSGALIGLLNAHPEDVTLKIEDDPFNPAVYINDVAGSSPAPYPERLLISSLNPNPENPLGRSLLDGLPFVSEILTKIFECIGTNWERAGNVRYAVTYNPSGDNGIIPEDCASKIAGEWSAAMNDKGCVRDFVAVGDIGIKVIGSDSQILDSKIPVEQMLQQIVAKTGIPPFLLGLSWSTTERMSSQQADILTSELEYYRSVLSPVIKKICREYLIREGYSPEVSVDWTNISLQDEVELARSRLYNAQAMQIENAAGKEGEV